MKTPDIAAVILGAGLGTRMKSDLPKVLHAVGGRPMIRHVLDTVAPLEPAKCVVVVGPGMDAVAEAVAPHATVVQPERLGTADAVKAARAALADFRRGTVLVLYGDTPMITTDTLRRMVAARATGASIVVLGFRPDTAGSCWTWQGVSWRSSRTGTPRTNSARSGSAIPA